MDAQVNNNMPVTSNEVRLKVPVGAFLNFRQESLAGYHIDDQSQIAILPGSTPQVIEASVTAVGGVYGSIKRADGSPADRGFATVLAMELPPSEKDSSRVNSPYSQAGFQFMKSVPFGGRYRLLVHEDTDDAHVWTVSEEFTIDESNPIVKMDVVLPSGRDLKLHVVDKDGKPVAAQEVKLSFSFTQRSGGIFNLKPGRGFGSHGFSTTAVTDSKGFCTFRNLSIDHPLKGVELKLTATIEPGPYRGKSQTISLNETGQPIEICHMGSPPAGSSLTPRPTSRSPMPKFASCLATLIRLSFMVWRIRKQMPPAASNSLVSNPLSTPVTLTTLIPKARCCSRKAMADFAFPIPPTSNNSA
jgi:hypothetical protein